MKTKKVKNKMVENIKKEKTQKKVFFFIAVLDQTDSQCSSKYN